MNTENCGRLPAMSTADPGFTALCTDALRREGVKGKRAAVTLRAGRLEIAGEDGGAIPIDLADVARLRILRNEGRYTDYFHADIVRTSRRDLLTLSPLAARDPNYSATMRALAMAIALSGGMARIERGRSPFVAWLGTVLVGLLFLVGLCAGTRCEEAAEPEEQDGERRGDDRRNCKATVGHTNSKFGSWSGVPCALRNETPPGFAHPARGVCLYRLENN